MTNEALVVEVAEWLEKAADNTDLERIARRIGERRPRFVMVEFVMHWFAGEITGIEYVVKHPVQDFQAAVGLNESEMSLLREFIGTNANSNIRIGFEMSDEKGELLCLAQLHHVPRGTTMEAAKEIENQLTKIFAVSTVSENAVLKGADRRQGIS